MKQKELQDIKNKPKPELMKMVSELQEKLRILKINLSSGKVKNIREIRTVKKSVAQLLTVIRTK